MCNKHKTDFYGRVERIKALKQWKGHSEDEEEGALIDGELFGLSGQNATCVLTPDVKPNTPPRLGEMVAAPAGTGSWTVLVGRQTELISGTEIHHPGGK